MALRLVECRYHELITRGLVLWDFLAPPLLKLAKARCRWDVVHHLLLPVVPCCGAGTHMFERSEIHFKIGKQDAVRYQSPITKNSVWRTICQQNPSEDNNISQDLLNLKTRETPFSRCTRAFVAISAPPELAAFPPVGKIDSGSA